MKELNEVEKHLKKLSKLHSPGKWKPESYIGSEASNFIFYNLKVPHIRNARENDYSFNDAPIEEQWNIWSEVWKKTQVFEAALSAVHFVNSRPDQELIAHMNDLLKWQKKVDNWALSDELSNCFSRLLELDRKSMLPVFKKWNVSKNPWDKRQSMVGLLFYSRFRSKYLPCNKILTFVKPHLRDDHYYVQKGVGWTLRECWNIYPEKTLSFLNDHAALIPAAGWTAATEKLALKDKQLLKTKRTEKRVVSKG